MNLTGVCCVLPTPFHAGGDIDHESLGRAVDLALRAEVDGVTALGATSEVGRLSDRERAAVVATVVGRVGRRVKVVVGTSADGVRRCIELSREAKAQGASAIMVSPPRLSRVNSETVISHYKAIAEAVDLPIVVQDYPPACGFAMEAGLLVRIAREVPAARTIKLEDPPTPFKIARILAAAGETRLSVIGGLGGVYLLEELLAGASGVMTGFGFPEAPVRICRHFRGGRIDEAAELFYRLVPLMRFECQEGIGMAIRKEIWRRRGALADASLRAPGAMLDEGTRTALDRLIAWTRAQPGTDWMAD
jgi:4-hydroxy-tetrahydrodipicolinate synthase